MDGKDVIIITVLAVVLTATYIACSIYGSQGLLVALIFLCATDIDALIEGLLVALILLALLLAWLGLNPIVWLGGASVAICIGMIIVVIVTRLWVIING